MSDTLIQNEIYTAVFSRAGVAAKGRVGKVFFNEGKDAPALTTAFF